MREQPVEHVDVGIERELRQQCGHCRSGIGVGQFQQCIGAIEAARGQCIAQDVLRIVFVRFGGEILGHAVGQRVRRIEFGDQSPAACGERMVHRAAAIHAHLLRIHAHAEQCADQARFGVFRGAGNRERMAALVVDRVRIGSRLRQSRQHRFAACDGRMHQRIHAERVARIDIGARIQQHTDDVRIAGFAGLHQRSALIGAARVHFCLVLEQQLHARDFVLAAGRSEQRRLPARLIGAWFAMRAVFEQEAREPPVATRTGRTERTVTGVVAGIDQCSRIQQQRGDAGIAAARGVMQRRVAIGIGDARVGAVREQHRHRFDAPMPAVARRCQQWREAGMHAIEIDPARDQFAQQRKIVEHRREHRQAALIAFVRLRQATRIGAVRERGKRGIDATPARGCIRHFVRIAGIVERQYVWCGFDGQGLHRFDIDADIVERG